MEQNVIKNLCSEYLKIVVDGPPPKVWEVQVVRLTENESDAAWLLVSRDSTAEQQLYVHGVNRIVWQQWVSLLPGLPTTSTTS